MKIKRRKNIFDAVNDNAFQRRFRVAFAATCHSSQGLSIKEPYLIHQWNLYTNKMRYVALSRATEYENINIYQYFIHYNLIIYNIYYFM